jgi:SMI1-KNR4 cell-wall
MNNAFDGFDFATFWADSEYARNEYVSTAPTAELVAAIERELGYILPKAYIEMAQFQNGGIPRNTNHRMHERTTWAEDHIAITGIFSISQEKRYSLGGQFGSRFWIEQWDYPAIGVYFADCPSAGHDMLCLDYRACGPNGQPQVVHVDQEWDYKITSVAASFEAFVRQLVGDEAFDED